MNDFQRSEDFLRSQYDAAYYRWIFCPESEIEEAKKLLDYWRHKWFNH